MASFTPADSQSSPRRRICVFCGSRLGASARYAEAAAAVGRALVARELDLVYGGGHVGLMGVVADAVLSAGGEVIGVIPKSLDRIEVAHSGLTELHRVDTMLERKTLMAQLSDGYLALPGGLGTLDELFEALTATQLRFDIKPCGLLDVDGFFAQLLGFLDHVENQGFLGAAHRGLLLCETDPELLIDRLLAWRPDRELHRDRA